MDGGRQLALDVSEAQAQPESANQFNRNLLP
jgi:hypothetical protein